MIPLTFRQLEVFVRVVEAGSFRACAEQLSVSQVSIGEHVRALERQLGCALFDRRRGNAAVLTQAGELAFQRAQAVLGSAVELLALFDRAPPRGARRRIRIGAHGFIGESLSKRLAAFIAAHPDVDIELQRRPFADVVAGLANNELEIGYFLSRGPVPELDSFTAWREEMGMFVGAGHRLAGARRVTPAELSGEPFAYLPARSHLRGEIASIFADLGIAGCPVAITSDDHRLIIENLLAGRSFACLFADGLAGHVARGEIVRLDFAVPLPPIEIRYAVRGAYRADRTANAVLECLNRER